MIDYSDIINDILAVVEEETPIKAKCQSPYRTGYNLIMKRLLLIGLMTLCCAGSCLGQTKPRRHVEFELGLGVMLSFHSLIFEYSIPGASPYAEIKYVFKKVPVDLGVNLSGQIFSRVGNVDSGLSSLGYIFEDTAHSNLNLRVAYVF